MRPAATRSPETECAGRILSCGAVRRYPLGNRHSMVQAAAPFALGSSPHMGCKSSRERNPVSPVQACGHPHSIFYPLLCVLTVSPDGPRNAGQLTAQPDATGKSAVQEDRTQECRHTGPLQPRAVGCAAAGGRTPYNESEKHLIVRDRQSACTLTAGCGLPRAARMCEGRLPRCRCAVALFPHPDRSALLRPAWVPEQGPGVPPKC